MKKFVFNNEVIVHEYGDDLKIWEEELINLGVQLDKLIKTTLKQAYPELAMAWGGRHSNHTAGILGIVLEENFDAEVKRYQIAFDEDRVSIVTHSIVVAYIDGNTYILDFGRGQKPIIEFKEDRRFFSRWKTSFADTEELIFERYKEYRLGNLRNFFYKELPPSSYFTNEVTEYFTNKPGRRFANAIINKCDNKIKQVKKLKENELQRRKYG